jgi:hypothetical protein
VHKRQRIESCRVPAWECTRSEWRRLAVGLACPGVVTDVWAANSREIAAALALANQTPGGSIRPIVSMPSMDRSKEAILLTPVLSAHATRYASAKSIRSIS